MLDLEAPGSYSSELRDDSTDGRDFVDDWAYSKYGPFIIRIRPPEVIRIHSREAPHPRHRAHRSHPSMQNHAPPFTGLPTTGISEWDIEMCQDVPQGILDELVGCGDGEWVLFDANDVHVGGFCSAVLDEGDEFDNTHPSPFRGTHRTWCPKDPTA